MHITRAFPRNKKEVRTKSVEQGGYRQTSARRGRQRNYSIPELPKFSRFFGYCPNLARLCYIAALHIKDTTI